MSLIPKMTLLLFPVPVQLTPSLQPELRLLLLTTRVLANTFTILPTTNTTRLWTQLILAPVISLWLFPNQTPSPDHSLAKQLREPMGSGLLTTLKYWIT